MSFIDLVEIVSDLFLYIDYRKNRYRSRGRRLPRRHR